MSTKVFNEMPRPEGVAPGGRATCRIPVGARFHDLYIQFPYDASDLNVAHFTEIRLFINGDVFQRFSGTQRDLLNQFDYLPAATNGVLRIPFDRVGLINIAPNSVDAEYTALNTDSADENGAKINSFYMEIDIDPTAVVGPADLRVYATMSDKIPGGAGIVPYIRSESRSVSGADTDYQLSDLVNPGVNAPDKMMLSRVSFIPNANAISNLIIERNRYKLFDRNDGINRAVQLGGVRNPQAGVYTIDTSEKGIGSDVIQLHGVNDYRYRLAVSGAMQLRVISEYYGVLVAN